VINRIDAFTDTSLTVNYAYPASGGDTIDKFKIEWDTINDFVSTNANYGSQEVNAPTMTYDITGLTMGTQYYVRVTAHNTGGYGTPANSVPAKPMQVSDPPFDPTLSALSTADGATAAQVGTSLKVDWSAPTLDSSNGDLVGNGGDDVDKYLIEWSKVDWSSYTDTVMQISVNASGFIINSDGFDSPGDSRANLPATPSWDTDDLPINGTYRLTLDTTSLATAAVRGSYTSANIPYDATPTELEVLLENMANIGNVKVTVQNTNVGGVDFENYYLVTFLSEVGNVPLMTVTDNSILDDKKYGASGQVRVTRQTNGAVPANAAYDTHEIDMTTHAGALAYTIPKLLPDKPTF
jgi:hypothetical protein